MSAFEYPFFPSMLIVVTVIAMNRNVFVLYPQASLSKTSDGI
ncbi:MAG: hypothetical protein R3277_03490 [Brumimicrobium sp.]|nr:hypothetical protein [Brumimicrobium sp.]